ncbi:MAG TPA: hypothetical protein DCY07_03020 [Rhodospirillaceae bacterium]|nr:hypothetical protein [Rhodospirillaceae bacterium]
MPFDNFLSNCGSNAASKHFAAADYAIKSNNVPRMKEAANDYMWLAVEGEDCSAVANMVYVVSKLFDLGEVKAATTCLEKAVDLGLPVKHYMDRSSKKSGKTPGPA